MNNKMMINSTKFMVAVITIICFVVYAFLLASVPGGSLDVSIYILSIFGWILWVFCVVSWHRLTGSFFDLYTIFISFAILFNFGQCLMWALGFHQSNEIGRGLSFGVIVSDSSIYIGQLVTLMGILAFHCGAICAYKPSSSYTRLEENSDADVLGDVLCSITKVTLVISTICMLANCIRNVYITRTFGYGANLYNESIASAQNNFIILLSWLFFPSIIAQLVTTDYKRTTVVICYSLFAIDCLLEFMAGDRGWIYWLAILVWMHHRYYKRLKMRQVLIYGTALLFVFLIAEGLSLSRGSGVSFSSALNAIKLEDNPIASIFFELGNSMKPLIIIIDKNAHYPYGNTYVLSILGMITDRIIKIFMPEYIGVGSWFSQHFLRISYGADFSIVAESFINYGYYFGILFMIPLGWVISKAVALNQEGSSQVKIFFSAATCSSILSMVRGTSTSALKMFAFSTLSIYLLTFLVSNIVRKSRKSYGG